MDCTRGAQDKPLAEELQEQSLPLEKQRLLMYLSARTELELELVKLTKPPMRNLFHSSPHNKCKYLCLRGTVHVHCML
jgi:hypothetical protein